MDLLGPEVATRPEENAIWVKAVIGLNVGRTSWTLTGEVEDDMERWGFEEAKLTGRGDDLVCGRLQDNKAPNGSIYLLTRLTSHAT